MEFPSGSMRLNTDPFIRHLNHFQQAICCFHSLQEDYQDGSQAYPTDESFGRECGGPRSGSPDPSCGLTKEDAQELLLSGELRPPSGLEQLSYMQDGQDLMDYDESSFFPPMEVQQDDMFCTPSAREIMENELPTMQIPNMLPQMSENSAASAETAGPRGHASLYASSTAWARTQDTRQNCTVPQPRIIQAIPVMAYPMPHAGFPGTYQPGRVGPEYPTVVAYYQGNPAWQYGEPLCGGWVPSGPMPMMEEVMELAPPPQMMQTSAHVCSLIFLSVQSHQCNMEKVCLVCRCMQMILFSKGLLRTEAGS
jgi:hypothetical protein